MKNTRLLILSTIIAGVSAISVSARGPGGGNGGSCPNGTCLRDPSQCDGAGPGQGQCVPRLDGSGKPANRGNPNSSGTPLKDGSGKATAPGKGAKDGTGNQANCPNK